ncbi:hypothetical protein TNCV_1104281 [Trichonephila clavipes]|nr:hypothetical protein TNCV_1104281 [Trichonephila clavipes]
MSASSSSVIPTSLAHADNQGEGHPRSAKLVFGYHFDMTKKRILTQDEIDRFMNNSDELNELSEDSLEYSDDDVDFYLIMCHLMKIRIATGKIVLVHKIQFRIQKIR